MSSLVRGEPQIVTSVRELRAQADAVRAAGGTVGFIGTSGNLHDGHLSLVRRMRAECDLAIMPFFLVPVPGLLEYGPGQGYERDFDRDRALAFDAGLDIAFEPTREEMYPRLPVQVRVMPDPDLAEPWRGAENPAFMSMAATALTKYWNVVGPCRAYYGEKDWVPLTVLRRTIEDLSLDVTLIACPTLREADGVCASSRNAKLSRSARAAAPILYRALSDAAALIRDGERSSEAIRRCLRDRISRFASVDYAEVVDATTLRRVEPLHGDLRLLASAAFDEVHLFDNVGVKTA